MEKHDRGDISLKYPIKIQKFL